ncbi:MAG: UDP-4-amino-4,6-dideoxy-N-acetyl-beta-L-altrosamine transaminase [Granulosicoccus sp.]|jgi:UDP-4-amino-4,6-dideoxy-N-acetyl-beta-L-altrosamine transaminase
MKFLPYGRQEITQSDKDAVMNVLESDFITQGPEVERFESTVASYSHAQYAVAVNSATSALHLACLALGVGQGDLVWTSPITFVASANCARLCGADVDFVDVDPRTYNLCADALGEKLLSASRSGRRIPKVVIAVHFAGQSCDMRQIKKLADEYNFRLIEDASHAIGARYLDKPVGNCRYSDICVFSFHPVKIITTAEGGLALCNDKKLYEKIKLCRTHGVVKQPTTSDPFDEPWRYEQQALGLNYRLTDIQAALGTSQMHRLDAYVARRHELAGKYDKMLSAIGLTLPYQSEDSFSAFHLYPVLAGYEGDGGAGRRALYHAMAEQGLGVNVHYIPVHTQPYYRALGHQLGDYPKAEAYYERTLSIPLFGCMTDEEQNRVIDCLLNYQKVAKAA